MAAPHRLWLIERLNQLGLSRADLARKMKVSKRQVERWFAGGGAHLTTQYDLALALELPPAQVYALFACTTKDQVRRLSTQGQQSTSGEYRHDSVDRRRSGFTPRGDLTLAAVIDDSGYSIDDVAFLSDLDVSLIRPLWDDLLWPYRTDGRVLQALMSAVPGVDTYLQDLAIHRPINEIAGPLGECGLTLNRSVVNDLAQLGQLDQYVVHALRAAVHIMGQNERAGAYLCRFWGQFQDRALHHLFRDGGLLADPSPLIKAAVKLCDQMAHEATFAAGVACANVIHHLAQAIGTDAITIEPRSRPLALVYRSQLMGELMRSNDVGLAQKYCVEVKGSAVMQAVEDWAFPTYAGDCRAAGDFSLPRSVLLKRTADEVVRELDSYNESHFHYLVAAGIPTGLRRDPSFGGRRNDLRQPIMSRLTPGLATETRQAARALLALL